MTMLDRNRHPQIEINSTDMFFQRSILGYRGFAETLSPRARVKIGFSKNVKKTMRNPGKKYYAFSN